MADESTGGPCFNLVVAWARICQGSAAHIDGRSNSQERHFLRGFLPDACGEPPDNTGIFPVELVGSTERRESLTMASMPLGPEHRFTSASQMIDRTNKSGRAAE